VACLVAHIYSLDISDNSDIPAISAILVTSALLVTSTPSTPIY
jgi:hypothetical protein